VFSRVPPRSARDVRVAAVPSAAHEAMSTWSACLSGVLETAEVFSPREHDAALSATKDGVKAQEVTGNGQWKAELHRLEGVALWGLNWLKEALMAFREALRIAHKQEAKAYELRAATSLAKLRGEQGRREQARELLAPVYGWFTEGFDTPDLREAKALLDELR
jgi:predicted ATPase